MSLLQSYFASIPVAAQKSAVIAYLAALDHLQNVAPSIAQNILQELAAQRSHLKLIASENFSSLAVQLSMGNLLTDKYCEGYPHHRFYAGCENVDAIEQEAIDLAKQLFGAEHAYVQPHSGADANLVAFWSILVHKIQNKEVEKLGKKSLDELTPEEYERIRQLMNQQKLMGMALSSGGHLTHGYRQNISSKMMRAVTYEIDPISGLLDYAHLAAQVKEEKPTILLAGYSAYSRKINFAKMREIADSVGAVLMVDMAHFAGLVAGKAFTGDYNPIPFAHVVSSTTHKTLRGPRGGLLLCTKEYEEVINKGCPLVLGGPLPHVIAAKAIAFREALQPEFVNYAARIIENAQALAEALSKQGIALVTGGTENHLLVIDVSKFGLTGRHAENALRSCGLTSSRNTIPNDPNGAWFTSGVRLGTPAVTTLGMGEPEMQEIAQIIVSILAHTKPLPQEGSNKLSKAKAHTEEAVMRDSKQRVRALLDRFPLYPELVV